MTKVAEAEIEQKLKEYFEKRDDVKMAFLFGSRVKGTARNVSDWDIAIYFTPVSDSIEWEESNRDYPAENEVWGACIDILQTDNVDLVVLNRAPATIADTAMRGKPLVIKDRNLLLRFMLIVTREAEDYRQFVSEFYAISERSASLTQEDAENLKRTIQFMGAQLALYPDFVNLSGMEYEEDPHKRNDVERWIENIINAAIDIAKIIMGSEKKLIPPSYRETMRSAVFTLKLPEDFIEKFERWVKLRNVLAHEYLDIKWKRISDFIKNSEPYMNSFTEEAKKFLNQNQLKE